MGSRNFKNFMGYDNQPDPKELRLNFDKEELKDGSPFPNPLTYEDIDREFKKWVEESLEITYEGKKLPTMTLFSNQRFSEYMQSWKFTDEDQNPILNFKSISRENNPKSGTINGESKNIPGEHTWLMKRLVATDKNNREYYIEYRMKQPFAVDLIYKVSVFTNKFELLNEFNTLVNDRFKAIDCYIRPNGHFMPMKLTDISDESEYNIDDRQFYSQSFNITVMAYIIREEDFITEERPKMKIFMSDTVSNRKSYAEVTEGPKCVIINDFYYKPVTLTVLFDSCTTSLKFHMDSDLIVKNVDTENIRSYKIRINDEEVPVEDFCAEGFKINKDDDIVIYKVAKYKVFPDGLIVVDGYDDLSIHDITEEDVHEDIIVK